MFTRGAGEPQLLQAYPGADLQVPAPDEQRIQGAVGFVKLRHISHFSGDLALLQDDAAQRRLVPLAPVRLFPFGIHPQVLLVVELPVKRTQLVRETQEQSILKQ